MKTETIQSLKDLQMRMPAIIQQYGSDSNFTQIALANPIVALERTGLQFTESAKEEIENYVRFGREGVDKLHLLKQDIYKFIGAETDLNDTGPLADALLRVLPPGDNDQAATYQQQTKAANKAVPKLNRDHLIKILGAKPNLIDKDGQDQLQPFVISHPVIPLLIAYRKMQADNPRFAAPEQIPVIEEKLKNLPLKNVVFTLKRNNKK